MTFRPAIIFIALFIAAALTTSVSAQYDSVIGQITNSSSESFAGGVSGDGRFVVFESKGNIATENPRNEDGNSEIFLYDYAQRRIFQITDTKSVLYDTSLGYVFSNIRVSITNTRPVISNDGKWIAFSSNATVAYPGDGTNPPVVSSTNPGSFDGNSFTAATPTPSPSVSPTPTPGDNPLTHDANLEVWLYQVPSFTPVADLSAGDELPLTDLTGGNFTQVSNSVPSQLPRGATSTIGAFIADDNHDASISDDGATIAFVSTRDLVPGHNSGPSQSNPNGDDNDEIFTYSRTAAAIHQITETPRGPISDPIYNKNPTIAGNGLRVVFASTGDKPIPGMTGDNPASSRNEEIFFTDLTAAGAVTGVQKQVTITTPTNVGDPVNILDLGKRMSKNGNLIAFDSYADFKETPDGNPTPIQTSFATYIYDVSSNKFTRILPRSDADSAALGGDLQRYPTFTDYDGSGNAGSVLLETRLNIKLDGTVAEASSDGQNDNVDRPAQLYRYVVNGSTVSTYTRIANFPTPNTFLASTQAITTDTSKRFVFNLGLSELGGMNLDYLTEVFYMITPTSSVTSPVTVNLSTGASHQPISPTVVPTPTPTVTPTPTPTPTGSPTPTPTPTPSTPPAVFGASQGMLVSVAYQAGFDRGITPRSGVGSLKRSFTLPIELSGVSVTINGFSCGLKYVSRHRLDLVLPPLLPSTSTGTTYPMIIFNNGVKLKTTITVVPTRPDLFNFEGIESGGGRAKVYNVTNRVHTTEPFLVRTIRTKPSGRVPSVLRVYLTGVQLVDMSAITIRIGNSVNASVTPISSPVLVEPGVYTMDFTLRDELQGAGDQPLVINVPINGVDFSSRLDDTAPRLRIL